MFVFGVFHTAPYSFLDWLGQAGISASGRRKEETASKFGIQIFPPSFALRLHTFPSRKFEPDVMPCDISRIW